MKCCTTLVTSLLLLAASSNASAEDSKPETHDGFYLTLGVGPALLSTSVSSDPEPSGAADTSIDGFGVGGLLLLGTSLDKHWVLGGGAMGGHFIGPSLESGSLEQDTDGDFAANLLGPFVDYYLEPEGGLHAMAMLGFATAEDGIDATDGIAMGFGVGVGLGYDLFVSDEWSVGALGRLQYLRTSVDTDTAAGTVSTSYSSLIPALLLTASYH